MPLKKPDLEELLSRKPIYYCEGKAVDLCVKIVAVAELPTEFGKFQVIGFYNSSDEKDHAALVKGDVYGKRSVPVRIHSECLTGDALGSKRCDCRGQLAASLKTIEKMGCGVLLYMRQEGRGIGLMNKLRAYQLQDFGYDTVEANLALGFKEDERDYRVAAHMLMCMDIKSVRLMTNNPRKMESVARHGMKVTGRIPVLVKPNKYNERYLKTKMEKSCHMLDDLFEKE